MAGDGPLRARIPQARGFVPHDELQRLYARAAVVVCPSRREGFGVACLEAMAHGRPVVATGRGGSGEYLRDGENALLFEAGDPDALAAAVDRLADDRDLRQRLLAGGLATAERHTETVFNETVLLELTAAASRVP